MIEYRTTDGQRLDTIIYEVYANIDSDTIEAVMDANPHLLHKKVLNAGDIVYLPELSNDSESTVGALWD